jgi:hypothetical protein
MNKLFTGLLCLMTIGLSLAVIGCTAAFNAKPNVVIDSPPSNSQYQGGEAVAIQSTSTDSSGIARVELLVDGIVVRTDTTPGPQPSFILLQTWTATVGTHTIVVRAFNTTNVESNPAAIALAVVGNVPAVAPTAAPAAQVPPTAAAAKVLLTATPASAPVLACTDNFGFVADVTVPDGTFFVTGQAFNKIWRIRNDGTCVWGSSYHLVFIGGQGMTAAPVIGMPLTAPGATADLLVPMTAALAPGHFTTNWRLRSPAGALFGGTLNATIIVLTPQPPATATAVRCQGVSNITAFSASPATISAGQSATLSWGLVENADEADIDYGIGGIATPGDIIVSPGTTTTYTLSAFCGSNVRAAQVTITVNP